MNMHLKCSLLSSPKPPTERKSPKTKTSTRTQIPFGMWPSAVNWTVALVLFSFP